MENHLNSQPLASQLFNFLLELGGIKRIRGHSFSLEMMPAHPIVLDLGANKGDFSRLLHKETSFSKCLCVEANPSLVEHLKHNLEDIESCLVINAAISGDESSKTIEFQISDNPEASSINRKLAETFGFIDTVSVSAITLNQLIRQYLDSSESSISLMKLDVEGAEIDILQTVPEQLLRNIEQITVEFHDFLNSEMRPSVNLTKDLLRNKHGFVCINARYPQNDDVLFLNKNKMIKSHGRLKFSIIVFYVKLIFSLRSLLVGSRNYV